MLVLKRKRGQEVRVGRVTVTVLQVSGKTVKLGFKGPIQDRVVRPELDDREPPRAA